MEVTKKFAVMGSRGFIGNEICKNENFIPNEPDAYGYKHKFTADYPDIVYLISTVHNYHPVDNNPYIDIQTNLDHLMTVLQANRMKYGNEFSITFVSSWFVYGRQEVLPVKETANCDPRGFYSITKLTAERLLKSYCETFGIEYKIVRLANVLGIEDTKVSSRKNALQYMIQELVNDGKVEVYDGGILRDYIHVSDAAEAIRRAARCGLNGHTYNAGSGHSTDVEAVIRYVADKLEVPEKVSIKPVPDFHKLVQVKDMWMDTTKITEDLDWRPVRQTQDIIDELVEEYSGAK